MNSILPPRKMVPPFLPVATSSAIVTPDKMMMSYESLDAWKGCHALVLATADARKNYRGPEKQMIGRLFYLALRAGGRLAFGKGTRNRKMFLHAVGQAAGYLAEYQHVLALSRVMSVLPEAVCNQCDALRGRASLYNAQLFSSLLMPRRRNKDENEGP